MPDYAAFISYSRASDHATVQAFQQVVQTLGKRWWARRALTLFRDDTHLSATPELWPTIVAALEASRAFILLATPKAAESPWVQQEVAWWLANRGPERMYLVVLDGTLDWDRVAGRFTEGSDACPPALRGAFAHEPKYIDLREYRGRSRRDLVRDPEFQSRAGDIAAALHGKPKVDLMGEEVRQQRQLVQVFAALGVVLLGALGVAGWLYGVSEERRRVAEIARADETRARQMADDNAAAAELQARLALQNQRNAMVALALSRAEIAPQEAISLVLNAWPQSEADIFPAPELAVLAISRSLSATSPHAIVDLQEGIVSSLSISPDRSIVAFGMRDGSIEFRSAESGVRIGAPLRGADSDVTSIAFSFDGARLISGSRDGTIRLWDVGARLPLTEPIQANYGREIRSVTFSPNGLLFASLGLHIRIWGVSRDGSVFQGLEIRPEGGTVNDIEFSSDSRLIVGGGIGRTINSWSVFSGQEVGAPLIGHLGAVQSVSFSPNGRYIASGSNDGTIRLWDFETRELMGEPIFGHDGAVFVVSFSSDGNYIVSGGSDQTLRFWDANERRPIGEPQYGHNGAVRDVRLLSRNRVVSRSWDRTVRFWDLNPWLSYALPAEGHSSRITTLSFSPDGQTIAGGSQSTILRWRVADLRLTDTPIIEPVGHIAALLYSPDGSYIASAGVDGHVRFWNSVSGVQREFGLMADARRVYSLAYSPDGELISTGGEDGRVRIWSAASGLEVSAPYGLRNSWATSLSFSFDNRFILAGGSDGTIRIIDSRSGGEVAAVRHIVDSTPSVNRQVTGALYLPSDGSVVSSGQDGFLRFWSPESLEPIGAAMRMEGGVRWIAASSVEDRILVVDANSLVLVDPAFRAVLGRLLFVSPESQSINAVSISADGRLIAASVGNSLRVWNNLPPGNLLQVACRYLPHINGRPDPNTDDLAQELGLTNLTLPEDCDTYDPPLPPLTPAR